MCKDNLKSNNKVNDDEYDKKIKKALNSKNPLESLAYLGEQKRLEVMKINLKEKEN